MQKEFIKPQREIHNINDVAKWLKSEAHQKYMTFLRRLNHSLKTISSTSTEIKVSDNTENLIKMIDTFEEWMKSYPPEDMGEQRFGNKAYRKWYDRLKSDADLSISKLLPIELYPAKIELLSYLMDSFGNSTRIDYGSGHEASFMIFLLCLYEVGIFSLYDDQAVVLRIFHRYLKFVRQLQSVYRMEPAGSRGVHAIDDFQFLPFMLI